MFETLTDRGRIVNALNERGLYTQKQVEELDKRVKELWNTVNNTYSGLIVYVRHMENVIDENYAPGGNVWSYEERKKEILRCCDEMHKLEKECAEVMFKPHT